MAGPRMKRTGAESGGVLDEYDATPMVGLRVQVHGAVIERSDEDGEKTVEVPRLRELKAGAAVARCLLPLKIRGWELRAIRKIMGCTLADLAQRLDERTAVETISRWETEAQPMGGYVEKLIRLLVCEELAKEAPGISYKASMIADMRVADPWITDPEFNVPYLDFYQIKLRQSEGTLVEAWEEKQAA